MTKMECSYCGRYYMSEVVMAGGSNVSHIICARCAYLGSLKDFGDDEEFKQLALSEIYKELKREKNENGWKLDEGKVDRSKFSPELGTKFTKLVEQVIAENPEFKEFATRINGERGDGGMGRR